MKLRADRREERRREALARNEAWASLPKVAKIESLKRRPGKSKRQLKRLGGE